MAKFLASLFEDTLGVVFEEFSKDQVSSSLFRGKFSASNLRIRRELLNEILFPFCADSASCKSVEIDLPVGSLDSMPLRVTIGHVFMNLSCSPHSFPPPSTFLKKLSGGDSDQKRDKKEQLDKDKSASSEKGSWSKVSRILCGILLEIDLVEVRVNVGSLSLRMCLRELVLQSASPDWSPVSRLGLLEKCFDESSVHGQVKIFKVLQINSLQLQILSLDQMQCCSIVDVAFKVNIAVSLLKDNLKPTLINLDAILSRFTVSLNSHQIERLYTAAFDIGRLFRSVTLQPHQRSSEADALTSDLQEKSSKGHSSVIAADSSNSFALPHVQVSFSLCKTEVVVGSSSPAALPVVHMPEAKIPAVVPSAEQKLSDGSAFKGNAAGYLERRSDFIKSWERRYVVVRDGDVAIFSCEEDAVDGKQPRKFFLLRDCEARPAPVPGHPHAFEVIVKSPVKKSLMFSTILAASGHVGYEARDYWIQAFIRSGSQASSGTRVVAVQDSFIEVPSIHHQAWQVALIVDPAIVPFEISTDECWNFECKLPSISLQMLDAAGSTRSLLSIQSLSVDSQFHSQTSTCSVNMQIEDVHILLLLQSYLKFVCILVPACFWHEILQLPAAKLLELFRGPPEVPSPLLTTNLKILINAPFHIQLPFSPIDQPVEKWLHLNFLFKVNVKSGESSRDRLRALDSHFSMVNFCASITSLNEASLLQLLPGIKSCSGTDEILNVLADTQSALLLVVPVIDFHARLPLRALDGNVHRVFIGEPFTACLSASALSAKRKMEIVCDIKQNSMFFINPLMFAAAVMAFKPMLLIAQEHSVFGIAGSINKLLSRISAAQHQIPDTASLVFLESPFEDLSEATLLLTIAHVSVVLQTSAHKSLLLRVTGIRLQASQEPRLEFLIQHIVASNSSHPPSELGLRSPDFVSSRILYNESKNGEPAVSLVVESNKAFKRTSQKQFNELELASILGWRDADSRDLFREDSSDHDHPLFSASIVGSVNGLVVSLNVDEVLSINYTTSLLNDLISVLKLIENHDFIATELFSAAVAESSPFFGFVDRMQSIDLLLPPEPEVMQDGLSRIYDAFNITPKAKCFIGCSIGLQETSSHIQFNTTRGTETIELCIPGVLVQMITSFSLREGVAPTSSVPLVISAMQEDKALAAMLAAIYGRTPNLHLVVAAQLSAFEVTSGPYGTVDPFPVVCDMRDVRVSWSTILLSPTSWDSRSGVRSCIGQLKFCPMHEFVLTLLAFQSLVQVNTQSVIDSLQIMEQKTAHINASVKEGRRLSIQHDAIPTPSEPQTVSSAALSVGAETAKNKDSEAASSSQVAPPCQAKSSHAESVVCNDEVSSLLAQFDQCRRDVASATSSVIFLTSSTAPLTVKQQILLKRDQQALLTAQSALETCQAQLFDRMRALVAEKNDALAAAQQYRSQIQSMQSDHQQSHFETTHTHSGTDALIGNAASLLLPSSDAGESQQLPAFPVELFDLEMWSASLFSHTWKLQKGTFHNGKLWTGSTYRSISERIQSCSQDKDKQHNFALLDCVLDEKITSFNGKEHALKFATKSDSKEHVFAFESAAAREKCLAQFKGNF